MEQLGRICQRYIFLWDGVLVPANSGNERERRDEELAAQTGGGRRPLIKATIADREEAPEVAHEYPICDD